MVNAKVIGKYKFENLVEKAVKIGVPLNNFIINLPKDLE